MAHGPLAASAEHVAKSADSHSEHAVNAQTPSSAKSGAQQAVPATTAAHASCCTSTVPSTKRRAGTGDAAGDAGAALGPERHSTHGLLAGADTKESHVEVVLCSLVHARKKAAR